MIPSHNLKAPTKIPPDVSDILYRNVYTHGSNQMMMIKSWGGSGTAKNLAFENFIGHSNSYSLDFDTAWTGMTEVTGDGITYSDITFSEWTGTAANGVTRAPIKIMCPAGVPCTGIEVTDFAMWTDAGSSILYECENAYGTGACLPSSGSASYAAVTSTIDSAPAGYSAATMPNDLASGFNPSSSIPIPTIGTTYFPGNKPASALLGNGAAAAVKTTAASKATTTVKEAAAEETSSAKKATTTKKATTSKKATTTKKTTKKATTTKKSNNKVVETSAGEDILTTSAASVTIATTSQPTTMATVVVSSVKVVSVASSSSKAACVKKTSSSSVEVEVATSEVPVATSAAVESQAVASTEAASPAASTEAASSGSSSGTGAALYGQCGGSGWTGPTTCAEGTCTVSNDWYSQCLS